MSPDEPTCIFSADRRYRYTLWREVNPAAAGYVQFIGLNPSTADETLDDPTIRRCKGFARDWGFRWLLMTNVFGFRATDPEVMKSEADPFGPDNLHHIKRLANGAGMVLCAWGIHGTHLDGGSKVLDAIDENNLLDFPFKCLGVTKNHQPRHPLYIKATQPPIPYS